VSGALLIVLLRALDQTIVSTALPTITAISEARRRQPGSASSQPATLKPMGSHDLI
jgi:hypothetical protein